MTAYAIPPETVRTLLAALEARGVAVCVGGGWAIDALVGEVTRQHADLDVWVDAADTEGRLHNGSVNTPFLFTAHDLSGDGDVGGMPLRCESPEFALQNHIGYAWRDIDRHDVALLCEHFGLPAPEDLQ